MTLHTGCPYLNFVSNAKQLLNGVKHAEKERQSLKKIHSQFNLDPVTNTRPAGGFLRPAAATTAPVCSKSFTRSFLFSNANNGLGNRSALADLESRFFKYFGNSIK